MSINIRPALSKACAFMAFCAGYIKGVLDRIKGNRNLCWALKVGARYLLCVLVLVAWTLACCRYGQRKALETYRIWMQDYESAQEAARLRAIETDPYTIQLNAEAESLARILYGVKDNDTDDLKTYCWCVFNRVDNPAYPDTLEDVIAQPSQWMRYDPTNPVLEPLYQLAREQLDAWHTDSHRPVSSEYVFMNWTPKDICLRNVWAEGSGTRYWRWGQ